MKQSTSARPGDTYPSAAHRVFATRMLPLLTDPLRRWNKGVLVLYMPDEFSSANIALLQSLAHDAGFSVEITLRKVCACEGVLYNIFGCRCKHDEWLEFRHAALPLTQH